MAGLKLTQLNDVPVAFWTFDYDRTGLNGNAILDEIGNKNPMVVHSDTAGDNYWLERQSLNSLEVSDQYAMSVAVDQKVDNHWREQFFEVVHSNEFEFPDKGQFSVEWLMYKTPAGRIRNNGEPGDNRDIITPLISKGTVFNSYILDDWGGSDRITISVMGRSISIHDNVYPIWNRMQHCVVTYKVEQTDVNEYESTVSFYMNGRLIGEDVETHIDTFPNTTTSDSWLFCGDGGSNPATDFATELLTMDQIAVYTYPLTAEQVGNHYRKTKQYDQMIIDDYPQHYWRFDEIQNPLDSTIYPRVGSIYGEYYGAVDRHHPGPSKLVVSHSPKFPKGSSGYFTNINANRYYPIIDVNQDYTLEFWFKSSDNDRGIIFDCTEEQPTEWHGLRVFLNSKGNNHYPGNIQVAESHGNYLTSRDTDDNGERYLFNDDEWHYVVIRRTDLLFELIIDGVKHAEALFDKVGIGQPGQIHIMNSRPGDYALSGSICELAFHRKALQDQQISNRFLFTTRYKIAGYTLLQGAPVKAEVRFYNSISGELVHKLESDPITGEYLYYPPDNRHLDMMSKLPENNTTRYRVHGPVAPAEYNDSHLN